MVCTYMRLKKMKLLIFFSGKKTKVNLLNVEKSIKNSKKSVVVAIEIGYSNSGICVSSKIDWRKMFTHKTPTCLLLKKDLSESLFGYEAEDKFSTMTREDRNLSYFFFQHFGMILYEDRVCLLSISLSLSVYSLFFFK